MNNGMMYDGGNVQYQAESAMLNGPSMGYYVDTNVNSEAMRDGNSTYSNSHHHFKDRDYVTATTSTVVSEMMPHHEQTGSVIVGPGARKEAVMLGLGLPRLSHRQHDDVAKAKKYAMEQSIKNVLMKQTVAHQQQQQKVAMYAQALSLMARVYIGSISFELREETIKNAFTPFGPIKSINMSWDPVTGHHKGFAFLEYEVPEAATLAQEQMNGVLMGGRNIKVGRPSNMPQAQPIIEMIMEEAKQCNRIYVASIHQDLTENDVKSVFEAFGIIRIMELAKGPLPGKHKGYAYIEYETEQAAIDAVASMNLFDLGGQYLRVGRAITPPQAKEYIAPAANSTLPTAAAVAAAAVTAKIQAMEATSPMAAVTKMLGSSPTISNAATTNSPTGQKLYVPPPGLAIPQLPGASVGGAMPPQMFGMPPQVPPNVSSPSVIPGVRNPMTYPTQFMPSPPIAPPQIVAPSILPPAMQQNVAAAIAPPQQLPPTASETVQKLLMNPTLTDKQKQLIEMESAQSLAAQEDLKIKGNEARSILMHKLMRRNESCVLLLRNMVTPEEVDDTLRDEVIQECSRFGNVEDCLIHEEKYGEDNPSSIKIFVKYTLPQEVETAKNSLDGRFFSGRQLKAVIYDQNLFDHNDYTG